MEPSKVKGFEKQLMLDEQMVRFLIVSTVRENTVYTKRAPVVKIESLANNEDDVNIDTTKEADIVPEIAEETKTDIVSSEEVK
jgi:hypothetical protein